MASSAYGSVKRRKTNPTSSTAKSTVKSSESCSEDECRFCDFIETSHWDSSSAASPASATVDDCALCLPDKARGTKDAAGEVGVGKVGKSLQQQFPVCDDPDCPEGVCDDCPEDVCDECSVTAKSCKECVDECKSSCPDFGPAESLSRPATSYSFFDSYCDMFPGASPHFPDYSSRLPHLPPEAPHHAFSVSNTYSYPSHLNAYHESDPSNAAAAGWKRSFDELELSRALVDMSASTQLLDSVGASFQNHLPQSSHSHGLGSDWMSASPMQICHSHHGALSHSVISEALPYSASPQTSPDYSETPSGQRRPSISQDEARERSDSGSAAPVTKDTEQTSMICQWADANGRLCGQVIRSGADMHEHLKAIHHTRTAVECRWLGCRVSASGPNPHKFANSVERHTWGHSGHRPYRCSVCFMGFAAAAVRDEHYNNFHLGCKNYECEVCGHRCSSARNLKRHKDEKHSAERYQCEFCRELGKQRLFPRGSNLARHFRKCRAVLTKFPEARGAAEGKIADDWFPPGYKGGPQGMDKAKVVPPM